MQITYLNSEGIYKSEKLAIEQMEKCFSSKWKGYASLELIDRVQGNKEIDLVIVAHDRLIIVELKQWNGVLQSNGDHWLLNDNDMGRSPVKVTDLKRKILAKKIRDRLPELKNPWVDYRVVLCGSANPTKLNSEEREYVKVLDKFLTISDQEAYIREFGPPRRRDVNSYIPNFDRFFKVGDLFKKKDFSFQNYKQTGDAVFIHRDQLYKEYLAIKSDDQRYQALLRRWDLSVLGADANTREERAAIVLRENRVLGFIHEQNEELDQICLQSLSSATPDDVIQDFCELYRLPSKQTRLKDFLNKYGMSINSEDRLSIIKILISYFADLHDIGVAHRDIGDHSIWLERSAKVALSGFITAYYPEANTIGSVRDLVRAGRAKLPEDTKEFGELVSDPFRRDIYLLAASAYNILYGKKPMGDMGYYEWQAPETDAFEGKLAAWFKQGLNLDPIARFVNARKMLDALNNIHPLSTENAGIDLKAFEPYRTDTMPIIDYRVIEELKRGTPHIYKSESNGRPCVVRIWYTLQPDKHKTDSNFKLLGLMERAWRLKSQGVEPITTVLDFGISSMGAFIVNEWAEGEEWTCLIEQPPSLQVGLQIAQSLVRAVDFIHSQGIVHGDLHPKNVIVRIDIAHPEVKMIDAIDYKGDKSQPYNPAYTPRNTSSPLDQRDRYAVAKMVAELLQKIQEIHGSEERIDRVIKQAMDVCINEITTLSLDKLQDTIDAALSPPVVEQLPKYQVIIPRISFPNDILSDNGIYYVQIQRDRYKDSEHLVVVSGVRESLWLNLDTNSNELKRISLRDLTHSQFIQNIEYASEKISATISVQPGPIANADYLLEEILQLPSIDEFINGEPIDLEPNLDLSKENNKLLSLNEDQLPIPLSRLWQALINAEEEILQEICVSGPIEYISNGNSIKIPYITTGKPLDLELDDEIEVLRSEGTDAPGRIGFLNIRQTNAEYLIIDNPRFDRLDIGVSLKLRSKQDWVSYNRRRSAIDRILQRESVISNLFDYFDPVKKAPVFDYGPSPTDDDFDEYNEYEGEVIKFSLNPKQRESFRKIILSGPISLLQGPPGTGKTAFIATFIHYLLKKGARNILLVSQSHEAVNNAIEKVLAICQSKKLSVDLVRFGPEKMISDSIRYIHADAIKQQYRELFHAEMRQRIISLSANLTLPKQFVEGIFDIEFHLRPLANQILDLNKRLSAINFSADEAKNISQQINQRRDRFERLAHDYFGYAVQGETISALEEIKKELVLLYDIDSQEAIRRLYQVIEMSMEWVAVLGANKGNFEEFLAKTRSIVCGTCVGIGNKLLGITRNRYDWVIVDEAARATPSELAVALQSGARILLVGDHKQLPAFYKPELISQVCKKLEIWNKKLLIQSDFQRLFESSYGHHVGARLLTQYRMVEPIGSLVSTCFYGGELENGRGSEASYYQHLPESLSSPVTWIDTAQAGLKSHDEQRGKSGSYRNLYEAKIVLTILRMLCNNPQFLEGLMINLSDAERPIGVICMYLEQTILLKHQLAEANWAGEFRKLVKIDTVDSYQGKQNQIIIISLVRNNADYRQGFLSSAERANVALSRAMERLFIVGSALMWENANQEAPFGQVLKFIHENSMNSGYRIVPSPVILKH